ncbi:MAG: threonine synthase, partial [Thermoproteota archaeon]
MDRIKSLKCRECSEEYTPEFRYICENCFGPLEVEYNYDKLNVSKNTFENREKNIWKYFELLPINDKNNIIDIG